MPLVASSDLPTFDVLRREGETILRSEVALKQDIRELHVGLLRTRSRSSTYPRSRSGSLAVAPRPRLTSSATMKVSTRSKTKDSMR